jgi:hypothetical protein
MGKLKHKVEKASVLLADGGHAIADELCYF